MTGEVNDRLESSTQDRFINIDPASLFSLVGDAVVDRGDCRLRLAKHLAAEITAPYLDDL